jgi:phosphatidylglycerophosphatase A
VAYKKRIWSILNEKLIHPIGLMIGTGFGSGLSPIIPGTCGSFVAALFYFLSPLDGNSFWFISLIIIGSVIGVWACNTLITPADKDPGKAVWDEFIGLWITCLFLPKEILWITSAFICFRILDIVKPFPAKRLENLSGGIGIMADDILVGIYGSAILNIIYLVIAK